MSLPSPPNPLFLPKFDLWCHHRGLKLREIAEAIRCSTESARRYRLPFGDEDRRTPKPPVMNRIVLWTGGDVQPADFYPSPDVARLLAQRSRAA